MTMTFTSSTHATPAPSLAAIEKAAAMLKAAGPEPIGEWMRAKGFPPESCLLVLPTSMQAQMGLFPPRYVQFSSVITAPKLLRDLKAARPHPQR